MRFKQFKFGTYLNEDVAALASHDNDFQMALSSFAALCSNMELSDFFILSTFKAKLTAVNANEYKPVHLYWLLNIHFARNPPKNRRSNPFIGRINKSKNAKSCLYFPREHIEHIFQLIFRTDNVSHRDLEKLWYGLNMHIAYSKV